MCKRWYRIFSLNKDENVRSFAKKRERENERQRERENERQRERENERQREREGEKKERQKAWYDNMIFFIKHLANV